MCPEGLTTRYPVTGAWSLDQCTGMESWVECPESCELQNVCPVSVETEFVLKLALGVNNVQIKFPPLSSATVEQQTLHQTKTDEFIF